MRQMAYEFLVCVGIIAAFVFVVVLIASVIHYIENHVAKKFRWLVYLLIVAVTMTLTWLVWDNWKAISEW